MKILKRGFNDSHICENSITKYLHSQKVLTETGLVVECDCGRVYECYFQHEGHNEDNTHWWSQEHRWREVSGPVANRNVK